MKEVGKAVGSVNNVPCIGICPFNKVMHKDKLEKCVQVVDKITQRRRACFNSFC